MGKSTNAVIAETIYKAETPFGKSTLHFNLKVLLDEKTTQRSIKLPICY